MSTARVVVAISLALLAGPKVARARARSGTRLTVRIRSSVLYDSNVFRYSDPDQERFVQRDPASRFGMRSVDDAVYRTAASVSVYRRLFGARSSRLRYSLTRYDYSLNAIRNYRTHALALRQPLPRGGWAELSGTLRPHYYLRHLWDDDFESPYRFSPRYQPAEFRSTRLRLRLGLRFHNAWEVSGQVGRRWVDYGDVFNERDSRSLETYLQLSWREGPIKIAMRDANVGRAADAVDPAKPAVPDSLRADVSYDQNALSIDISFKEGTLWRMLPEISLSGTRLWRRYTGQRPADIYHTGRRDRGTAFGLDLERRLTPALSVFASYRRELRWSSGVGAGANPDVSEFGRWSAGGGLRIAWAGRLP